MGRCDEDGAGFFLHGATDCPTEVFKYATPSASFIIIFYSKGMQKSELAWKKEKKKERLITAFIAGFPWLSVL